MIKKSILILTIMLILTGCEESELKGSNNSKIIETIDTDESNDIKLSYYEHFIFEFSSGDTCSILFTSATEDQINFKIHVGEPYLIDGEVPTAENCVGTLCGEVVEFDFVDNYNNAGTGTLSFDGDAIILKTIIEEANPDADYSLEAESRLVRVESYGDVEVDSSFIFDDSDRRYIREEELLALSKEDLGFARNEIFARHGYIFNTPKYASYFHKKTWYDYHGFLIGPNNDPNEYLNDFEIKNIELIKKIESNDVVGENSQDITLCYYEYFIYEFCFGDPCSITFGAATDNKINFEILAGGPYRTDGKSATAEACVGTLQGDVVEFDFTDNYNNKGTGTLKFERDYVILKTKITEKNPDADYSVELDSKLGRLESYTGAKIDSAFIFPDSDSRYLNEQEIAELSRDSLGFARNEIYARHGYDFNNPKYASYFYNKTWYDKHKSPEFPDKPSTYLNDFEIKNIELIKKIENKQD